MESHLYTKAEKATRYRVVRSRIKIYYFLTKLIMPFLLFRYICTMLRKAGSLLMAFLIITQSLMNLGLYAYYNINKKMIADKLCINKSKPQMHCNGHCFLSKQLKQAEEKEKQQLPGLKEKEEQAITFVAFTAIRIYSSVVSEGIIPPYQDKLLRPSYPAFIPPPETTV